MNDKIAQAEKAARIADEIAPYLEEMEREAFEAMLGFPRTTEEGREKAMECLRLVEAARGLKGKLIVAIETGKRASETEGMKSPFA